MQKFALRLPKDLHKAIKEMAQGRDISMNSLIVVAIERYVKGAKK